MKTTIIILLLSLLSSYTSGQSSLDFEQQLYASYIDDRISDWKGIIGDMKAVYQEEKDADVLYSLCFAQYGYIGHCIGDNLDSEAEESLKEAIENTKKLEELLDGRHDVLALQGALLGFKIMLSKFKSLYLGPRAYKLINTASESSDTYFNCSLEIGNMRYFTPKFLGGSKEEAIEYYKNAVYLLENSIENGEKNWIYINTVLLLANAYYETGSEDLACELYKGILEFEPQAKRIRDELDRKCR